MRLSMIYAHQYKKNYTFNKSIIRINIYYYNCFYKTNKRIYVSKIYMSSFIIIQ